MSKIRATLLKVLGTKGPWSLLGLHPISPVPGGEEKIDGCHWGINMIFFFIFFSPSLTLGGQVSLSPTPPSLHSPSQP